MKVARNTQTNVTTIILEQDEATAFVDELIDLVEHKYGENADDAFSRGSPTLFMLGTLGAQMAEDTLNVTLLGYLNQGLPKPKKGP